MGFQIATPVDVAATPGPSPQTNSATDLKVPAALGSRNSFLGIAGNYGAVKIGKTDAPYKLSTARMDPFANTVGDYNSIMGNTGGDNRAEFDWRMPHAIWYESPIVMGFQFSALASPGQNPASDNSDFSWGDLFQCPGSSARASGSGFPDTPGHIENTLTGGFGCTDGSYGNAYSAALTYKNGPFTAIAAYELHEHVNRHAD